MTVFKGPEELKVVGQDRIDPHAGGMIKAFARIGYKLPEAIADIVDNSIDAGARHALIRFFCSDDAVRRIAVVDDGHGMTAAEILQGMQFGAEIRHGRKDLGKFGIGLKSASFSQCQVLSVLTRKDGVTSARRWTVESINQGWSCSRLDQGDADRVLDAEWAGLHLEKHGTVVLWDDLDRLDRAGDRGIEQLLKRLFRGLRLHLGIVHHRFLAGKSLKISLDARLYDSDLDGLEQPVEAIDPFAYQTSGNKHYPKAFKVDLSDAGALSLEAHIWPPRSAQPEYKLGGSAASGQGFFFYRNGRLIQAGGWNKLRQAESEPHLSLARVKIDLPSEMDSLFRLDVQKSALDVPAAFEPALARARAGGVTFDDYLRDAQATYRRNEAARPENRPVVLGSGVPAAVRREARDALADGKRRQRKVKIKWQKLAPMVFFEIDRQGQVILLNKAYRDVVEGAGKAAREANIAVIKTLLFLLLRDEFDRKHVRRDAREWLDDCNSLVLAALEKGDV